MFGRVKKLRQQVLNFLKEKDKIDERELFIGCSSLRCVPLFPNQKERVEDKLPDDYLMSLKGEYLHVYATSLLKVYATPPPDVSLRCYMGRININRLEFVPKNTNEKVTYRFNLTLLDGKTTPLYVVTYDKKSMLKLLDIIEKTKSKSKQQDNL